MTGGDAFRQCVADARDGHPSAWTQLYDRVAPMVYGYLRSQALDDPDDVAGETFLQVVRDIHRFEGTERQFRSWALAIAHHRMLDARRAHGRRAARPVPPELLVPDAAGDQTTAPVLEAAQWEAVEAVLRELTRDQRDVVVLRVVDELTLEETARVLDRTVGSVKALQHRAYHALRAQFSGGRSPTPLQGALRG